MKARGGLVNQGVRLWELNEDSVISVMLQPVHTRPTRLDGKESRNTLVIVSKAVQQRIFRRSGVAAIDSYAMPLSLAAVALPVCTR